MIQYDGIQVINNLHYIKFINERGYQVMIPVEKMIADRFVKYLSKLAIVEQSSSKIIDNEEESD